MLWLMLSLFPFCLSSDASLTVTAFAGCISRFCRLTFLSIFNAAAFGLKYGISSSVIRKSAFILGTDVSSVALTIERYTAAAEAKAILCSCSAAASSEGSSPLPSVYFTSTSTPLPSALVSAQNVDGRTITERFTPSTPSISVMSTNERRRSPFDALKTRLPAVSLPYSAAGITCCQVFIPLKFCMSESP